MSAAEARRLAREADPWWGEELPLPAETRPTRPPAAAPPRRHWTIAVLRWPVAFAAGRVRRSPRLRRAFTRLVVTLVAVSIVGGAVGVILLNNVVIRRTAELGELDDRRRELRRENAVLAATASRLSAPPRIVNSARTRLGMAQAAQMPKFIYLDGCSRTLTPLQRQRVAARATRMRGGLC